MSGSTTYPWRCPVPRSAVPFDERQGMLFVGNFRHLPNGEAVEYLCREILPRLDPDLLAEHPLYVVGSRLEDMGVARTAAGLPNVKMVGWVPSVEPYLERARVCVAPLLHGAGVKGKILESLMAGTPVVTTTLGAEGTRLRHGDQLLIADTPEELADGHRATAHGPRVLAAHRGSGSAEVAARACAGARAPSGSTRSSRACSTAAAMARAQTTSVTAQAGARRPTSRLSARGRGDAATRSPSSGSQRAGRLPRRRCAARLARAVAWALPARRRTAGGPATTRRTARRRSSTSRPCETRGARYFVRAEHAVLVAAPLRRAAPPTSTPLTGESTPTITCVVFDLASRAAAGVRARGAARPAASGCSCIGSYDAARSATAGAPRSRSWTARNDSTCAQQWRPRGPPAPAATADGERGLDPARRRRGGAADGIRRRRSSGSSAGLSASASSARSPLTCAGLTQGRRSPRGCCGVLGREVGGATPLPVPAVRRGRRRARARPRSSTRRRSPRRPIDSGEDRCLQRRQRRLPRRWRIARARGVMRGADGGDAPRISVLIATYERPELLAECLKGFCRADAAGVRVRGGRRGRRVRGSGDRRHVLAAFAPRLPLTWTRIEHAGRSAAKNLAVLLARGDLVLFFDDDDRPVADLLDEHIRAHARHPDEATAILGYTDWDARARGHAADALPHRRRPPAVRLPNFEPGQRIDWRGFWEGRVSSKRSLHLRHGLHDQRLEYSIDVELAWRLRSRDWRSCTTRQPAA